MPCLSPNNLLNKQLEIYKNPLEAKSNEIESKNKVINDMVLEQSAAEVELGECSMEEGIDIDQLLRANLDGALLTDLLEEPGMLDMETSGHKDAGLGTVRD